MHKLLDDVYSGRLFIKKQNEVYGTVTANGTNIVNGKITSHIVLSEIS